jgi:hypothetical protein
LCWANAFTRLGHNARSLDYGDGVVDGLYEVFGDFPEVEDKGNFPALDLLRRVRTAKDDQREVRWVRLRAMLPT